MLRKDAQAYRRGIVFRMVIIAVCTLLFCIATELIADYRERKHLTRYEQFITEMWPKRCESEGLALRECYIKWAKENSK